MCYGGWLTLAYVVEHREERLTKKNNVPCSSGQADPEKPMKSTMCSMDNPVYDRIKEGSEEREEARKRCGL